MKCHKASVMRELVCAVGGVVRPEENRKGWLRRVARAADISDRSARAAFYGELRGDTHAAGIEAKLRAAVNRQEKAARNELAELRDLLATVQRRLNAIDPDFHRASVDAIGDMLGKAGGSDPAT